MSERKFKIQVTEDELKALIRYNTILVAEHENPTREMSERVHDLVKRLNRETPEIENDPRPQEQEADKTGW